MSTAIANPFPFFYDRYGRPLTGGKVYLGEAGEDPELAPVDAFFDVDLTLAAAQPINVIGGLMSRDGSPARVFVDEGTYSIRVRDADGAEVFYLATAVLSVDQFQPLDADLTAIAALVTTPWGRALLTMANGAALRAYAGIVDALPRAGGTMTGEILRDGGGPYVFMADDDYVWGRIFVTANGDPDPRAIVGDIWLEEEAP